MRVKVKGTKNNRIHYNILYKFILYTQNELHTQKNSLLYIFFLNIRTRKIIFNGSQNVTKESSKRGGVFKNRTVAYF